ncbi:hypothetical protein HMPREF0495_01575 [Levilactobacillus brevis ATCC 14869 = DSM 20054]|uniref:Uncharacterized protein n=1 Tax=Levilactobacillus brevis ATCC 14869 = DSM 20054 TaxID=649758 RepID=U2NYV8_LEVBR|nr:hypothetical protein HMPREF0495_01575 [Levilactobacillus brevis ATCC 14869 = DSM 20054]
MKTKQLPRELGVAYFLSALYDGLVVFFETNPVLANHRSRHGKRIFSKSPEALKRRTHLGGNYF